MSPMALHLTCLSKAFQVSAQKVIRSQPPEPMPPEEKIEELPDKEKDD